MNTRIQRGGGAGSSWRKIVVIYGKWSDMTKTVTFFRYGESCLKRGYERTKNGLKPVTKDRGVFREIVPGFLSREVGP
jgi:hypothetical protein